MKNITQTILVAIIAIQSLSCQKSSGGGGENAPQDETPSNPGAPGQPGTGITDPKTQIPAQPSTEDECLSQGKGYDPDGQSCYDVSLLVTPDECDDGLVFDEVTEECIPPEDYIASSVCESWGLVRNQTANGCQKQGEPNPSFDFCSSLKLLLNDAGNGCVPLPQSASDCGSGLQLHPNGKFCVDKVTLDECAQLDKIPNADETACVKKRVYSCRGVVNYEIESGFFISVPVCAESFVSSRSQVETLIDKFCSEVSHPTEDRATEIKRVGCPNYYAGDAKAIGCRYTEGSSESFAWSYSKAGETQIRQECTNADNASVIVPTTR